MSQDFTPHRKTFVQIKNNVYFQKYGNLALTLSQRSYKRKEKRFLSQKCQNNTIVYLLKIPIDRFAVISCLPSYV